MMAESAICYTQYNAIVITETIEFNIDYVDIYFPEGNERYVRKGKFGTVKRGQWKGQEVAVKLFPDQNGREMFQYEWEQLSRLSHPNIIRLYGVTEQPVTLVMEYADSGSLYERIHSPSASYDMSHAISWVLQCATGMAYLHSMKPKAIVHRDLKSQNLLLFNGGTDLKISDFGTARDIRTLMSKEKGTVSHMAPEVFKSLSESCITAYNEKCDVYSWGIILWEVISRRKPYYDIDNDGAIMFAVATKNKRPPLFKRFAKINSLLKKCWTEVPDERPSMIEIVSVLENWKQNAVPDDCDYVLINHNNSL